MGVEYITTVHVAGPAQLRGLYQACARCGHVLQDFTGSSVMTPEGHDTTLPVWPEGQCIAASGNATWTIPPDTPLAGNESECETAQ